MERDVLIRELAANMHDGIGCDGNFGAPAEACISCTEETEGVLDALERLGYTSP